MFFYKVPPLLCWEGKPAVPMLDSYILWGMNNGLPWFTVAVGLLYGYWSMFIDESTAPVADSIGLSESFLFAFEEL